MNWDDARHFLALARAGTLSGAAKLLDASHTTVGRRVETLESRAGTKLFTKTPDGYVLTAAGLESLPLAEALEESAHAWERRISGQSDELAGRLNVTTVDLAVEIFAPAFGRFRAENPEIELSLHIVNQPADLSRREADVAIRFSNAPPPHLVGRKLCRFEWLPCASPALVERMGPDTPLSEWPWALYHERFGARMTEAWFREVVGPRVADYRVDSGHALWALVDQGFAATLLPQYWAQVHGFVPLGPVLPDFGMDVWVLTHPDLRRSAPVRAFGDVLHRSLDDCLRRRPERL